MKRFAAVALLCLVLVGCREPGLLEGLDQLQANEVVSVLQRNNIAASKMNTGKAGFSVSVRASDFAAAVDLLKLYSLPSSPRMEIAQMFPADSLVASPRAEKARLYSALEQRLEQSLKTMESIATARVHVSYDVDAGEGGRKSAPVHLSALVIYESDVEPQLLISDIKRFLRNSFAEVSYENISVVLSKRAPIQHALPSLEPRGTHAGWYWMVLLSILLMGAGAGAFWWQRYRPHAGAKDAVAS